LAPSSVNWYIRMKITVVAIEIPYPPTHGGRVDIWRHIEAFHKLGIEVQLICWSPDDVSSSDRAAIESQVSNLQVLKYSARWRRLFHFIKYPLRNTSRILEKTRYQQTLEDVEAFQPDVILIEGLSGCILGSRLSKSLDVPFVYRSQNIEHQHCQALYEVASGRHKLSAFFKKLHLEKLEHKTLKDAKAYFDISADDLQFWQSCGHDNGYLLPPLLDINATISAKPANDKATDYDVVFLGNLFTENNVAGIEWFLQSVLPIALEKKPDLSVLIAGSSPLPSIVELCNSIDCVTLLIGPESAEETFNSGRVLINPIAVGGGVSIKTIDMLTTLKPIVTLKKGIYGLDGPVKDLFHPAEDAESFANQVMLCLQHKPNEHDRAKRKQLIEKAFGIACMEKMIDQLRSMLDLPAATDTRREETLPSNLNETAEKKLTVA